jgi:hypothetical protein
MKIIEQPAKLNQLWQSKETDFIELILLQLVKYVQFYEALKECSRL